MRQEAWPIASDAWEWPCMAGVLVVREALVVAHEVLVVVRARGACASARTSSCFVLHEVADRFSDLGVGLSGLNRVGTARGKHEECRGVVRR